MVQLIPRWLISHRNLPLNSWAIGDNPKIKSLLAKDALTELEKEQVSQAFYGYFEQIKAEEAIAFYNNFLERQNRYQQETPDQRQAEKVWLAQRWLELGQV
jgi:hypothetical protein